MTDMEVKMGWTKTKAVNLLSLFQPLNKRILKDLSDYDLFNIGLDVGAWIGSNPFEKEKVQSDLNKF